MNKCTVCGGIAFIAGALIVSLASANHNTEQALVDRVSAVGKLNITAGSSAVESAGPVDGESVYDQACAACHDAGIAGAPVIGEFDDWVERIEKGLDVLVGHAINGFQGNLGVMPARGGNPALSDEAVAAAVEYMVEESE